MGIQPQPAADGVLAILSLNRKQGLAESKEQEKVLDAAGVYYLCFNK